LNAATFTKEFTSTKIKTPTKAAAPNATNSLKREWDLAEPALVCLGRDKVKLVVQRVLSSSVTINSKQAAKIGQGLTILIGIEKGDAEEQAIFLVDKIANLRIFADENGKMNKSCLDINGEILAVSQFTLAGDCSKGRRPGFDNAAPPKEAEFLYNFFIDRLQQTGIKVQTGVFAADMLVDIQNDGPVTFLLEK
jgi:D-tyrosyl-tRNA(Tyr) deacylase